MRGTARAGWVGMALATLLLVVGVASAARLRTRTVRNVGLTASGSLTYTWSGDPARGCAAAGVCGIHGELILRPQPSGQSVAPGLGPITVSLNSSGATRVVREVGGAVVGECVDSSGSGDFLSFNAPARRTTPAAILPSPSSGRCAGPTSDDLAGLSIPVRRIGRFSFDLAGTRSFIAGPFSGTLVSTMRIVPAPASSQGFSSTSTSSGPTHAVQPAVPPLIEFVQLQYRVSEAPSAIQTQFTATSDPSCQILDACGTSGSLAFSVAPSRTFTLIASRVVHRHLSRQQVLNDLRRGRISFSAFGLLAGRVSETFNWPDGSSCHDSVTTPSLLLSNGPPRARPSAARTIPVTISSNGGGGPGTDVFRTHCPGPADADLFGESSNGGAPTYARGSITTAQLLARRSVLTLSDPGSFAGLGYVGSRTGSIILDLTLTKVTAHSR